MIEMGRDQLRWFRHVQRRSISEQIRRIDRIVFKGVRRIRYRSKQTWMEATKRI